MVVSHGMEDSGILKVLGMPLITGDQECLDRPDVVDPTAEKGAGDILIESAGLQELPRCRVWLRDGISEVLQQGSFSSIFQRNRSNASPSLC